MALEAEGRREAQPIVGQTELRERLSGSRVVILGCGGLGSNAAALLLRSGVRTLTLVDDDRVEESNLNRQMYFADQVGDRKVDALAKTLLRIDRGAQLTLLDQTISEESLPRMVEGADAVLEAVDSAEAKALVIGVLTRQFPDTPLVAASGLAGVASANLVRTERLGENAWVCGDLSADIRDGHALVAPRVMLAAAHEALAVVRVLLGLDGD